MIGEDFQCEAMRCLAFTLVDRVHDRHDEHAEHR